MTRRQKLGGAAALVVLALLGAGALALDALARSAVEAGLSRTLGTETTVASLDVGVFSGRVTLEGLRVANPEGFEDPPFLTLERGRLAAGLATVLRDTVEVRELSLEGVELSLRQRGTGSNVGPILTSVREARGEAGERGETAYRIDRLVIRDVTARVRVDGGPAGETGTVVRIPEIRLEGVGSGTGGALPFSELAGRILQAVLEAVARESGGLPGSLRGLLQERLRGLPGGLEIRLPGGEEGNGLRERAEDRLEELVPGPDGGG